MTALAGLPRLTFTELRLQLRELPGLFFPFALPVLILVMNGMAGPNRSARPELRGLSALDAYIMPLTMIMIVTMIGLVYVPVGIAGYREMGVLRRLSVTPVRPVVILLAQGIILSAITLLGTGLALAVGRIALGVRPPAQAAMVVAGFLLGMGAMWAIGLLVAAVVPTVKAVTATGLVLFLAVMAVGGGFTSRNQFPGWLEAISEYTPFGAAHAVIMSAWMGGPVAWAQLATLAAITAAAGTAGALLFRWE